MRESIINVLKNSDRALDIYELQDRVGVNSVEETKEFTEELRKLEDEVVVYHSNKDKYMLFSDSNLRKGVLRVNKKGFGFVEIEGEDEDIAVKTIEDVLRTQKVIA